MLKELICAIVCANVASAVWRGSIVYNDYEYAYYGGGSDTTNWVHSQRACPRRPEGTGGILAMVKTREIDYNIGTLMDELAEHYAWLGGTDVYWEGHWTWADGTPFEDGYTNWSNGEPNNSHGGGWSPDPENCLIAWGPPTISWNDFHCTNENIGSVCQFPLSCKVPSEYSQLSFHEPTEKSITFFEARETCEIAGARLVQITNEKSRKAIMEKLESVDHAKYWVDMENDGSQCSVLSQDGPEEHNCNEKGLGFICETARPNLIKISEQSPVIAQSKDLKIDCTVFGFPVPDAAWYRDKKLVPNQTIGAGSATLVITNASEADEGKYVCIATNVIDGKTNKIMGLSTVSVATDEN